MSNYGFGSCYIIGKVYEFNELETFIPFANAERAIVAMGYKPVNPARLKFYMSIPSALRVLYDVLFLMKKCNTAYVISNWKYSKAAGIERLIAEKKGLKMIYEELL